MASSLIGHTQHLRRFDKSGSPRRFRADLNLGANQPRFSPGYLVLRDQKTERGKIERQCDLAAATLVEYHAGASRYAFDELHPELAPLISGDEEWNSDHLGAAV